MTLETVALALERWDGPVTAADESVLSRVSGPVLDVGCGPGRHVHALARRGVLALGLDASPAAIRLARDRGAPVHEGSVFEEVPGTGRWASALLLDGSVGIGGMPVRLLRRVRELLAPDGCALVEVQPPGTRTRMVRAFVQVGGRGGAPIPWAVVGADRLDDIAHAAGFSVIDRWEREGRCFGHLA